MNEQKLWDGAIIVFYKMILKSLVLVGRYVGTMATANIIWWSLWDSFLSIIWWEVSQSWHWLFYLAAFGLYNEHNPLCNLTPTFIWIHIFRKLFQTSLVLTLLPQKSSSALSFQTSPHINLLPHHVTCVLVSPLLWDLSSSFPTVTTFRFSGLCNNSKLNTQI